MGDYTRAAQMFLNFAGPMSPKGRALSAINNFSGVGQMEGAVSRKAVGPKAPVAKQAAKPTPFAQESIKRGGYGHGGVVSHKSISACEKAMTRKK